MFHRYTFWYNPIYNLFFCLCVFSIWLSVDFGDGDGSVFAHFLFSSCILPSSHINREERFSFLSPNPISFRQLGLQNLFTDLSVLSLVKFQLTNEWLTYHWLFIKQLLSWKRVVRTGQLAALCWFPPLARWSIAVIFGHIVLGSIDSGTKWKGAASVRLPFTFINRVEYLKG